jgi:hypothetical protein
MERVRRSLAREQRLVAKSEKLHEDMQSLAALGHEIRRHVRVLAERLHDIKRDVGREAKDRRLWLEEMRNSEPVESGEEASEEAEESAWEEGGGDTDDSGEDASGGESVWSKGQEGGSARGRKRHGVGKGGRWAKAGRRAWLECDRAWQEVYDKQEELEEQEARLQEARKELEAEHVGLATRFRKLDADLMAREKALRDGDGERSNEELGSMLGKHMVSLQTQLDAGDDRVRDLLEAMRQVVSLAGVGGSARGQGPPVAVSGATAGTPVGRGRDGSRTPPRGMGCTEGAGRGSGSAAR